MTDTTTDLPNERAFHLILEQQIAESARDSDARPLSVLALNVRDFDLINSSRGHAAGDDVLNFVARITRENLRQMDFLARAADDEFIVILPTATNEVSQEIIARISKGSLDHKFPVFEEKYMNLELNFGWAALGDDGETPQHLLGTARLRRSQFKSTEQGRVLWFSRELVS